MVRRHIYKSFQTSEKADEFFRRSLFIPYIHSIIHKRHYRSVIVNNPDALSYYFNNDLDNKHFIFKYFSFLQRTCKYTPLRPLQDYSHEKCKKDLQGDNFLYIHSPYKVEYWIDLVDIRFVEVLLYILFNCIDVLGY